MAAHEETGGRSGARRQYGPRRLQREESLTTIEREFPISRNLPPALETDEEEFVAHITERGFTEIEPLATADRSEHGTVYSMVQPGTGRKVAMKRLHKTPFDDEDGIHLFESHTFGRLREMRTHLMLPEHHPNILELIDFGSTGHSEYLLMERCDMSVERFISDSGGGGGEEWQPLSTVLNTTWQIFHALSCLHACDLMHKDIHPGNILLSATGDSDKDFPYVVKLMDFGLSEPMGDIGMAHTSMITPLLAPDHLLKHATPAQIEIYTPRSDMWSAAAVGFLLASGHAQVWYQDHGDNKQHDHADLYLDEYAGSSTVKVMILYAAQRAAFSAAYGAPLGNLFDSLLDVNPTNRPPTADAVLDIIEQIWKERLPDRPSPAEMLRRAEVVTAPRRNARDAFVLAGLRVANRRRRAQDPSAQAYLDTIKEYLKSVDPNETLVDLTKDTAFFYHHLLALHCYERIKQTVAGADAGTADLTNAVTWKMLVDNVERARYRLERATDLDASPSQRSSVVNTRNLIEHEFAKAYRARGDNDRANDILNAAVDMYLTARREDVLPRAQIDPEAYFIAFQYTRNISLLRREIWLRADTVASPTRGDLEAFLADARSGVDFLTKFHNRPRVATDNDNVDDAWVMNLEAVFWLAELGRVQEMCDLCTSLFKKADGRRAWNRQVQVLDVQIQQLCRHLKRNPAADADGTLARLVTKAARDMLDIYDAQVAVIVKPDDRRVNASKYAKAHLQTIRDNIDTIAPQDPASFRDRTDILLRRLLNPKN